MDIVLEIDTRILLGFILEFLVETEEFIVGIPVGNAKEFPKDVFGEISEENLARILEESHNYDYNQPGVLQKNIQEFISDFLQECLMGWEIYPQQINYPLEFLEKFFLWYLQTCFQKMDFRRNSSNHA